jgi:glycosyltransferase involved in cell wall biosynthesis
MAVDGTSHWPTISVVIPTRDRPELLARALRAVTSQDYPGEIECLVVFDQSVPVETIPSEDQLRRIRPLINARAPGLAGARNTGILAASGDLVAFCDDDDEWLPDKLATQVRALRSTDASVVVGGIDIVSQGRVVSRVPRASALTFEALLRSRTVEAHPSTVLVRRSALLGRIGLIDESIPGSYGEDYEWLLRAARAQSITVVRRPVVCVYWHPSSWFAGRWSTVIPALHYLLHKVPEFQQEPRGLARIYGRLAFAYAASGNGRLARRWAVRCLRLNWHERRGYMALAVSSHLASAPALLRLAQTRGRGI